MNKKKEVEINPDAEEWVAEEDARFEAEVAAAQSDDDARADARRRQAELEEEQMEWEHSQGPEGNDEEGHQK